MALYGIIKTSVIVVNYNGKRYLEQCLLSLREQIDTESELLLIDNASTDGSPELVAEAFPWVRLIRASCNLGFAAGNNLGISQAQGEYLVLLNNDTEVELGWLSALVATADADPKTGAVGSKLLFYGKFIPVTFSCATFIPSRRGYSRDERTLGFRLGTDLNFLGTNYSKTFFESGFYQEENTSSGEPYRWSQGVARVLLPCRREGESCTLILSAACGAEEPNKKVALSVNGHPVAILDLVPGFRLYQIVIDTSFLAGAEVDVINNAGSFLQPNTRGGDFGFAEMDHGQFEEPGERDNLCGGSVLLRRRMLEDVGCFDERLFMYYEDTDLFWRARKRGWKLLYAPQSVVRHIHAGSSGEWSPFFCYYVYRNRFLISLKNGTWSEIVYNLGILLYPLVGYLFRLFRTFLIRAHLDTAALSGMKLHLRIIGSAARHSIHFLCSRNGDRL